MVEVRNLSFQYPCGTEVLRNVNFTALPGEVTAVIGANGVGKTTLLKCIAGLMKGSGEILMCGQNAKELSGEQAAGMVGYLSQNTTCDANLNVYEVILLGLINQLSFRIAKEDMEKVEAVLELMSISHLAQRKITELSGGQQQLVFIAQTLIKDPKIMIMDEPTSALDLKKQFQLMNFLQQITHEKLFTTLLTLHHLDIAARYADRVVVIHDGNVYANDRPEKVFSQEMLRDVYEVESEIYRDRLSHIHVVAVDTMDKRLCKEV